jgi:hypothetical protein
MMIENLLNYKCPGCGKTLDLSKIGSGSLTVFPVFGKLPRTFDKSDSLELISIFERSLKKEIAIFVCRKDFPLPPYFEAVDCDWFAFTCSQECYKKLTGLLSGTICNLN